MIHSPCMRTVTMPMSPSCSVLIVISGSLGDLLHGMNHPLLFSSFCSCASLAHCPRRALASMAPNLMMSNSGEIKRNSIELMKRGFDYVLLQN